jgi:hypothetical protein
MFRIPAGRLPVWLGRPSRPQALQARIDSPATRAGDVSVLPCKTLLFAGRMTRRHC